MAEHRFLAQTLRAPVRTICELPLSGVSYESVLNGAGALSATVNLPHSPAVIREIREALGEDVPPCVVVVERDGVVRWSGVAWATDPVMGRSFAIAGVELWSAVRMRRIRWDATYSQLDQAEIARSLLLAAQTSTGGDWGIEVGAEVTGRLRDRTYAGVEGKPLGEAIEQLGAVSDGFDWSLGTERDGTTYHRRFRVHYPRQGRGAPATGHVWELGRNVVDLNWPCDRSRQATSITATGAGDGPAALTQTATATALLDDGWPLFEDTLSLRDVSVASTLLGHATRELADRQLPVTLPTLTVPADRDPVLGEWGLGDEGRIRIQPGDHPWWPDGLDRDARIVRSRVTVPDEGTETAELTFDQIASFEIPDG